MTNGESEMKDITWSEYQQRARTTAVYPSVGHNPHYVLNGLIGELGEVTQLIKKIERNDKGLLTQARAEAMRDEVGDCFWYIANMLEEFNIDAGAFFARHRETRVGVSFMIFGQVAFQDTASRFVRVDEHPDQNWRNVLREHPILAMEACTSRSIFSTVELDRMIREASVYDRMWRRPSVRIDASHPRQIEECAKAGKQPRMSNLEPALFELELLAARLNNILHTVGFSLGETLTKNLEKLGARALAGTLATDRGA